MAKFGDFVSDLFSSVIGRRNTSAGEKGQRRDSDRRSHARFRISATGHELLELQLGDGRRYPLADLSVGGLGFEAFGEEQALLASGVPFEALLALGEVRVPVRLQVVNARAGVAGCKVIDPSPKWREEVGAVLNPLMLAEQLREIDQKLVAPDEDGLPMRWFQAGPTCDLQIWMDAQRKVQKAQLAFVGQVVEWCCSGVRTGRIRHDGESGRDAAALVQFSEAVDSEALAFARRMIGAARLPDEVRSFLR
jgi:hypothetical protein